MSVSSRQPLIRISKNGEMRLKNKVGLAILKENAHEDRALNSQIVALKKHQDRRDKYMTYRQLDFATKQIIASEERPRTIASTLAQSDNSLPPIHSINLNESMRRRANTNVDQDAGADFKSQRTKGTWEKAMALVRVATRNRQSQERAEQSKTFITQQSQLERRREHNKRINELGSTTLPPLTVSRHDTTMKYSRHGKGKYSKRQPSFPEMLKMSREKSKAGLQDPRFLKLESCLGGEGTRRKSYRKSLRDTSTDE